MIGQNQKHQHNSTRGIWFTDHRNFAQGSGCGGFQITGLKDQCQKQQSREAKYREYLGVSFFFFGSPFTMVLRNLVAQAGWSTLQEVNFWQRDIKTDEPVNRCPRPKERSRSGLQATCGFTHPAYLILQGQNSASFQIPKLEVSSQELMFQGNATTLV